MPSRPQVVVAVLAGIGAVLAAGDYAVHQWERVVITLHNEVPGSAPITDIALSVRGHSDSIKELKRGQPIVLAPEPTSESGLVLQYKLGRRQCHWDGGYVEPTGGYRVALAIRGCGDVKLRTSLWPW